MFLLKVFIIILYTLYLNRTSLGIIVDALFIEPFYDDRKLAQEILTGIPAIKWVRFSEINGLSFDMPSDWKTRELTWQQRDEYYGKSKYSYILFVDAKKYGTVLRIASPILYNRDYWGSTSFSYLEPKFTEKVMINGKEFLKCPLCNQGMTDIYVFFGEYRIFEFEFMRGLYLNRESQKAFNEIANKLMNSVVIVE